MQQRNYSKSYVIIPNSSPKHKHGGRFQAEANTNTFAYSKSNWTRRTAKLNYGFK